MQIPKVESDTKHQRKSLAELGLVLPYKVWLALFLTYVGSGAVCYLVPTTEAPLLRTVALAVSMFIMGIFFAFKFPLWVPRAS